MSAPDVVFRNVLKVFGPEPEDALALREQGMDKAGILGETGCTLALDDVTLDVPAGRLFVIMGLSGSGKSTLIRLVNRLVEPTHGDVLAGGRSVLALDRRALTEFRRRKVSMVFQKFALFPHMSVIGNVAYSLKLDGRGREEAHLTARKWIKTVGLEGYETALPHTLSGGMQQRVGLARALAADPDILLMDEPFGALDPIIRREMQDHLAALQKELGKTILFITHDLAEAVRLADSMAILQDGRGIQTGTPRTVLKKPATAHVRDFVATLA